MNEDCPICGLAGGFHDRDKHPGAVTPPVKEPEEEVNKEEDPLLKWERELKTLVEGEFD